MAASQVNIPTLSTGTALDSEESGGKQTPQHGSRDGAHATIGAKADSAAPSGSGTYSLIALIKGLLNKGLEATSTPAAVALTASTSATLLSANANRIRVAIYNPLATPLFVRKAASAASATAGGYDFVIPPGGQWISEAREWSGELRGFCATAGSVNVSEAV